MGKQIDVTDLPEPLVAGIEQMIRTYREHSRSGEAKTTPRPSGWLKGKWELPDSFFDPLPDDLLDLFEGKSEPEE